MTIYLVVGETGEYADHTKWNAMAFSSLHPATSWAKTLSDLGEWKDIYDNDYISSITSLTQRLRQFDSKAMVDYTGTKYHVEEIKVG